MTATRHRKTLIKLILFQFSSLAIFFTTTDPNKLPVILLIVPVVWLFFSLSLTIYVASNWSKIPSEGITRKDSAFSMVVAGVICSILLLRSVNQLNSRDILLTLVFLVIAGVYTKKLKLQAPTQ